jgi:hypothetical protein
MEPATAFRRGDAPFDECINQLVFVARFFVGVSAKIM